jgi:hypothetical protein
MEILSTVDSMPSKEIFKLAGKEGFNERTLARARKEIVVRCFLDFDEEGNRFWCWRLPKENDNEKKIPGLSGLLSNLPKIPKVPIQY